MNSIFVCRNRRGRIVVTTKPHKHDEVVQVDHLWARALLLASDLRKAA